MAEKLKYDIGKEILVKFVIDDIDSSQSLYRIETENTEVSTWLTEKVLESIIDGLPPKPKVTPAVMDWYEENKTRIEGVDLLDFWGGLVEGTYNSELEDWLFVEKSKIENQHALATLIAYGPEAVEVEKEKKYRVKIKRLENTDIALQYLVYDIYGYRFEINTLVTKDSQYEFTKQELIDAGFEGVFDNPMFEVEEVEE